MTRTDGHRWVPHTRMPTGAARRASMLEAQTRRMPHSLRDAMEMESGARDTGSLGRMQIAISGMKSDPQTETHLMNLVEFFRTYSRAQLGVEMQGAEWPNLRELSRDDGYRGPRWLVEGDMSYYRGGRESELDGSERSCMSLAPRLGTWEERLPLGVRVRADEIGAAIARGVAPPHAPHEQVNYGDADPGSGPWEGDTSEGYARVHDAPKRGDPLTRLALRLAPFERGDVHLRTLRGVEVRCGEVHREALTELDATGEGGRQGCVETRRALARVAVAPALSV
jgi:hypothetical protein